MTRAPAAIVVLVAFGLLVGLASSRWYYTGLYSERIEVLQLQLEEARTGDTVVMRPTTVYRVWPSVIVWCIALVALTAAALMAYRSRIKSEENASYVNRIGRLQADVSLLTDDRDRTQAALKDKKHEYAIEVLERYSNALVKSTQYPDGIQPTVTIRFANYGQDHDLAQQIKGLFTQYVKWQVRLDGSNSPALPRAERFKVLFDVGMTHVTYGHLIHAFGEGDLLGVPVGVLQWIEREDSHHLIAMVLPSVGAEPVKADPV